MPIHDWTRVRAGIFHDFHLTWIGLLKVALNDLLPGDYYALAEARAGNVEPDILTLSASDDSSDSNSNGHYTPPSGDDRGGLAVAEMPPRLAFEEELSEAAVVVQKQRRIAVRHVSGDRVVAFLEIVSPGNKDGRTAVEQFVDEAVSALGAGLHFTGVDLIPPGPHDPSGLHAAIWADMGGTARPSPPDRPLTLWAYRVDGLPTAYVEPTAVGLQPVDVPLFFTPDRYVNVPLADTYAAAYNGVPKRWRRVIEGEA